MSVMCGKCEILIHSTSSAEIGSQIGMQVIPFNIQIMNKLLPFYNNEIEVTVSSANEGENTFSFEFEDETIEVPNHYFKEGTKLKSFFRRTHFHLRVTATVTLRIYILNLLFIRANIMRLSLSRTHENGLC